MTNRLKQLNNSFQKRLAVITDSGLFRLCSWLCVLTKDTTLAFIAPHVNWMQLFPPPDCVYCYWLHRMFPQPCSKMLCEHVLYVFRSSSWKCVIANNCATRERWTRYQCFWENRSVVCSLCLLFWSQQKTKTPCPAYLLLSVSQCSQHILIAFDQHLQTTPLCLCAWESLQTFGWL